jgi:hypothetical protein
LPIRRSLTNAAKPELATSAPQLLEHFHLEDAVSRDEIISVIQKHSKKLGRTVQLTELVKSTKISRRAIRTHFGNYAETLRACGLEGQGYGYRLRVKDLFLDWAKVVRKLGKVPTVADFELHGKYSYRPFGRVFAGWKDIPSGMIAYANKGGPGKEMERRAGYCREALAIQTATQETRRTQAPHETENPSEQANLRATDNVRASDPCPHQRGRGDLSVWRHVPKTRLCGDPYPVRLPRLQCYEGSGTRTLAAGTG